MNEFKTNLFAGFPLDFYYPFIIRQCTRFRVREFNFSYFQIRECLGQLAVSTEDETQWKYLNYQVLLCIRNSDIKVTYSYRLEWSEMKCQE